MTRPDERRQPMSGQSVSGQRFDQSGQQPFGLRDMHERYRILAKLGAGGMADVFLAIQLGGENFRRFTVIKRMRAISQARDKTSRMFINEARVVASLNHPHIVKVFDLGWLDQDLGIAMEYVDGESLQDLQRFAKQHQISIPLPVVLKLMVEAAEALHYAHSAESPDGTQLKLIHRDVGPQNLLLTRQGYLKVIDFGVAKSSQQVDITTPGLVKGKIPYFAPETLTRPDLDGRADLYALGLVMFELITQEKAHPFGPEASLAEVVHRITTFVLPPASALAPDLPHEIDAVVSRATRIERDERYQTGAEFAAALRVAGDATTGIATTAEVEQWFVTSFDALIQRRREFERHALAQAEWPPLLQESASGSGSLAAPLPTEAQTSPSTPSTPSAPLNVDAWSLTPPSFSSKSVAALKPWSFRGRRAALAGGIGVFLMIGGGGGYLFYRSLVTAEAAQSKPEGTVFTAADNLFVASKPAGATVMINGEKVGNTGESGINLRVAAGKSHELTVKHEGYRDYRINVLGESLGQRQITAHLASLDEAVGREFTKDDNSPRSDREPGRADSRNKLESLAKHSDVDTKPTKVPRTETQSENKPAPRKKLDEARQRRSLTKRVRREEPEAELVSNEAEVPEEDDDGRLSVNSDAEDSPEPDNASIPLPPPPPPLIEAETEAQAEAEVKAQAEEVPSGPVAQSMTELLRRRVDGDKPVYPERELNRGVSEVVVVKVRVSAEGSVESYDFVSGATVFRRSVRRALSTWRFSPVKRDGVAAESTATLQFTFRP